MDSEQLKVRWGANIRAAREVADLTQAAVGRHCGVNQSTVAKWEAGTIMPVDGHRLQLSRLLGVSVHKLFSFDEAEPVRPDGTRPQGTCGCGLPTDGEAVCEFCADLSAATS